MNVYTFEELHNQDFRKKLIINKIIIILQKFNTNINEYQFKFTFFVKFWFHKQGIEVQATLL